VVRSSVNVTFTFMIKVVYRLQSCLFSFYTRNLPHRRVSEGVTNPL